MTSHAPVDRSAPRSHLVRRAFGLVSVYVGLLGQGFAARTGRWYGWSMALAYGALLAHRAYMNDADGVVFSFRFTLLSLSASGGLVAWGAARDLSREEGAAGFPILAQRLGFAPTEQDLARVVASMVVVTRAVLLPGAAAAALGLGFAPSGSGAFLGLTLFFALVAYAATFGAVLGGLARWVALLSPRHGRTLLLALALGPPLLGTGPDLVGGVSWMVDRVLVLAGGVA